MAKKPIKRSSDAADQHQIEQKKLKSVALTISIDIPDPQEGTSPRKEQSISPRSLKEDSTEEYQWGGNTSAHGISYEKDLAFTLFSAASLKEHSFWLATEMKQTGYFMDTVFVLDDRKETWLFNAKHSQTLKGALTFNDFFPGDERTQFSLPMCIQSYLNIQLSDEFKDYKKRYFIYTNKPIGERAEIEKFFEIHEHLLEKDLEKTIAVKFWEQFTPKIGEVNKILDKMNILPVALKNAIVELIESGRVLNILFIYSTPLQSILKIEDNSLQFTSTFISCRENSELKWLYDELREHFNWNQEGKIEAKLGKALNLQVNDQMRQLFVAKSKENIFPGQIREEALKTFFECLIICTEQPDELSLIRNQCIESFIETWIGEKGCSTVSCEHNFFKMIEKEFKDCYKDSNSDMIQKPYLGSSEGNACTEKVKAVMRNRLQQFSKDHVNNSVERAVIYTDIPNDSRSSERELINMMEMDPRKCCILVGEPGAGKTIFLKRLACLLQTDIRKHVYLIYMNKLFKNNSRECNGDISNMFKLALSKSIINFFDNSLNHHRHRCYVLLDGFNEIDVTHQKVAIDLIKNCFCKNKIRVFISGRHHVKETLEEAFQVKAFTLVPLEEDEQIEVMRTYFYIQKKYQIDALKFNQFAKQLLQKLFNSKISLSMSFFGLPFTICMLAEINREKFDEFLKSNDANIDLPSELSLFDLFELVFIKSFKIFVQKLFNLESYLDVSDEMLRFVGDKLELFNIEHQKIALTQLGASSYQHLHPQPKTKKSNNNQQLEIISDFMQKMQNNSTISLLINFPNDNRIEFVHPSYVEYFVAKYLFENVKGCRVKLLEQNELVRTLFFSKIEENFNSCLTAMKMMQRICNQHPYIMYLAGLGGHENIFKALVKDRDIRITFPGLSPRSGTLLHAVVHSGSENLVAFLCEHPFGIIGAEVNIDTPDDDLRTPISWAAYYGHTSIVNVLLKHSASVEIPDKYGYLPLHRAVKSGRVEIVKLLIDKYAAKSRTQDELEQSVLHLAAASGQEELVKMLIDKYLADINIVDNVGWTPLHAAAKNGHLKIVKMLLNDFELPSNNYGQTPLHVAAANGKFEIVQMLLCSYPAHVNTPDQHGQTLLHLAAKEGYLETVRMLIVDNSANINSVDKDGQTPLHLAVNGGHLDVSKLLICKFFADIRTQNKDGWTPLHVSASSGESEIAKLLIDKYSSDIDFIKIAAFKANYLNIFQPILQKNKHVKTMLKYLEIFDYDHLALYNVETPIQDDSANKMCSDHNGQTLLPLLVAEKSTKTNIQDEGTQTILHFAPKEGCQELLKERFEDNSANINTPDKNGQSALHLAVKRGHSKVVKILIDEKSINVNLQDKNGQTALHLAVLNDHAEIFTMLKQNNLADINIQDKNGNTPLQLTKLWEQRNCDQILPDTFQQKPPHHDLDSSRSSLQSIAMLTSDDSVDIDTSDEEFHSTVRIADFNYHFDDTKMMLDDDLGTFDPSSHHLPTNESIVDRGVNSATLSDFVFTLFVAATLEERPFRLTRAMQQAGKFDDAMLILDDQKEMFLFQVKLTQNSTAGIEIDALLSSFRTAKEPYQFLPFSDFLQLKECENYRNWFYIFTNSALKEGRQSKNSMDVKVCSLDKALKEDIFPRSCNEQLSSGESEEKSFPKLVDKYDSRTFLKRLRVCAETSDNLLHIRDTCIKAFIEKWIEPMEHGMFADRTGFHQIFESEFQRWQKVTDVDMSKRAYLSNHEGNECITMIKSEMRFRLQSFDEDNFSPYIERALTFNESSDENPISEEKFIEMLASDFGSFRLMMDGSDSSVSDKYVRNNQRFSYEKDLALTLFVAASCEERPFRLTTELRYNEKCNDVALIWDNTKEIWFFKTKYSHDTSSEIKLKDLLPDVMDDEQPFSFPMFIQSLQDVLHLPKFQAEDFQSYDKRLFMFTNESLDVSKQLKEIMAIQICSLDKAVEKHIFSGTCIKVTPKEENIDDLLEKMNIELISVRSAIVKLLAEGKVSHVLLKYRTALQSMLQLSGNSLRLTKTFMDGTSDASITWLKNELQQYVSWNQEGEILSAYGKALSHTDSIGKLLSAESGHGHGHFPKKIENHHVREFLNCLVVCLEQPDELFYLRDKCIKAFAEKWIPTNDRSCLDGETELHKLFEEKFQSCQTNCGTKLQDTNDDLMCNLSNVEGAQCLEDLKTNLRKRSQKLSEADFRNYVARQVITDYEHSTELCFDEEQIIESLENASDHERLFVLEGEPGSGKSFFMKKILFLLQADINKHVYLISVNLMFESHRPEDKGDVFTKCDDLSVNLMNDSLTNHQDKCFILLDGFDEIDVSHLSSAIEVIKKTFCEKNARVLLNGRKRVMDNVRKAFPHQVRTLKLIPLKKDEQLRFLSKYWNVTENKHNEVVMFNNVLGIDRFQFTGLPLIIRMLTEIYRQDFENFQLEIDENKNNKYDWETESKKLDIIMINHFTNKMLKKDCVSMDISAPKFVQLYEAKLDLNHRLIAIDLLNFVEDEWQTLTKIGRLEKIKKVMNRETDDPMYNIKDVFAELHYAEYWSALFLYKHVVEFQEVLLEILKQQVVVAFYFFLKIEENFDNSSQQMEVIENICKINPYVAFLACQGGHVQIVEKLLKDVSKTISSEEYDGNLLHAAVQSGSRHMVLLILGKHDPAQLQSPDGQGLSPLDYAIKTNNLETVKILVNNQSIKFKTTDKDGNALYHYASSNGSWQVAKYLMNQW